MYRDLTSGLLYRNILRLAFPAIGMMVFQSTFELIDIFWIGKLGHQSIAAISVSSFILWGIMSIGSIISTGQTAIIARRIGEKDFPSSIDTLKTSVFLCAVLSILFILAGIPVLSAIFNFMTEDSTVIEQGLIYTRIMVISSFFLFLFMVIGNTFNAIGNNIVFFKVLISSLIINIVLDPILIFGWFFFPEMGIQGAAAATAISRIAGCSIGLFILRDRFISKYQQNTGRKPFSYYAGIALKTIKIGSPPSINGFLFSMIYIFIANIISRFGTEAIASMGLVHKVESMTYFIYFGFSQATMSMVGQNLGAKQTEKARKSVTQSLLLANTGAYITGTMLFLFGPQIFALFTDNSLVIEYSSIYIRILYFVLLFHSLEIILSGAFQGSGWTLPVLLINTPITALRIPIAYTLAVFFDHGVLGVWLAIHFTTLLKGLILYIPYKKSKWYERSI